MDKETNIADVYKNLVKIFEEQMLKENMPLWFFDLYLPDIFARRFISKGIKTYFKIAEREETENANSNNEK